MSAAPLTLTQLLELLGHTDDEHVQLCQQGAGQPFASTIYTVAQVADIETNRQIPQDRNVWFSPNPTMGPPRQNAGRGGAAQVTRLAALWADLDIKTGGCPNLAVARQVVDDLAAAIGTPPVAITASGHGLQPLWAVEDAPIGEQLTTAAAAAMLRRWGRLVTVIADRRHANVDAVWDLPRILRAPATVNWKNPQQPIPVVTAAGGGAPITIERLLEVLDEYAIPQLVDDGTDPGTIVSPPANWEHADVVTCAYARKVIAGWPTDQPTARHPWLVAQAVRLAAMHRNQCMTDTDHQAAEKTLTDRFTSLVSAAGDRGATPGEIRDALTWAALTAATFSEQHLAAELGGHTHTTAPPDPPPVENLRLTTNSAGISLVTPTANFTDGATVLQFPAGGKQPAELRNTDDGNATALIDNHGQHIRYCPERGRWLTWDTHRWTWEPSGGGQVRELAKKVARDIPDKPWRNKSLSAVGTTNTLTQAATDRRIVVTLDHLDNDPWALNTPGGTVDLRTGRLHPAQPEDHHTRATSCTPDPQADPTVWLQFLNITFGGDQELIAYMQRLVGYSATGHIGPHILPFAHGSGGNGKGAFLEAIAKTLGDYATSANNAFLMARNYSAHETEIARLAGARLVICSEVNAGDRFDEAKVKLLTGGDTLTARFMRQDHFTFRPTHHLWLLGNHRPAVTSGGRSFWRRCRLIPFEHEVPEDQVVDDLQGILARDHGPAILQWIAEGAAEYHHAGLREPHSVTAATAEYAHDQDTVGRFVEDMCHLANSPQVRIETSRLTDAYNRWCTENGETPVSSKQLGADLRTRFAVGDPRSNGRRFYAGITLITEPTQDADKPW